MSTPTERSAWSPEEVVSLENVDKEIQLVSTSSESHSISNFSKENELLTSEKVVTHPRFEITTKSRNPDYVANNSSQLDNQKRLNLRIGSSEDDLCAGSEENHFERKCQGSDDGDINYSTIVNSKNYKKSKTKKYNHVQSKIKHFFDNKYEESQEFIKSSTIPEIKEDRKKQEYLEEINKQLTKELDEKNAILQLLQENYEQLLFKYAEAQNRIDELRFKCMTENSDSKSSCMQLKCNKGNKSSPQFLYSENYLNNTADIKDMKVVVNPIIKAEEQSFRSPNSNLDTPISRPLSLPLDSTIKFVERDLILTKATTPTDSEGLSSIITSMSGHSKILNSLDEENQINKKSNLLKCSTSNFILEENSVFNDPFDKVKNWQNSLPPLEQIETPETGLYNVFSNNAEAYSSCDTKYNEIISPKIENEYAFLDESCPPSWRDEHVQLCKNNKNNSKRPVSLPNTLAKRNIMESTHNKKNCQTSDIGNSENNLFQKNCIIDCDKNTQMTKNELFFTCQIESHQNRPLLRCSSLPAYDRDRNHIETYKNEIYVPPLDLGNITLSDEESYCHQNHYVTKNNEPCIGGRGGSIDRSIQTPKSFSSSKTAISEENFFSRASRQAIPKSTSVTSEKIKALDILLSSKSNRFKVDNARHKSPPSRAKENTDQSQNWCNICGESFSENKSDQTFRNRSTSCESVHSNDGVSQQNFPRNRPKPPFKRSISFGSETITPKYCSHDERLAKNCIFSPGHESLENFDVYAKNLKVRSQVAMKALTAHINNS